MPRKTKDSVVVITGAASGIGRATALQFARKGATLVLASRRAQALEELAQECKRAGAQQAITVPTDVSDESAVQALGRAAIENFGRIDVWVNNAAVTLFGRFEESPPEDYRRVIEVNLFGYIYGARTALKYFREQGSGVLIDVSSIVSSLPQPYTSAYSLSKAAIRSLGMSLRQELTLDGSHDIHVCTVMPATIDTPFFQQAANYTGRPVRAMPPVLSVDRVAQTIVRLARKPRREVTVGNAGRQFRMIRALAPAVAERMMATQVDRSHLYTDKRAAPTAGNLYEPMPQYAQVSGNWTATGYQQDEAAPGRSFGLAGLMAAATLPAIWWWRRRQRQQAEQRTIWARVQRAWS
jgi:short-subunit dehydrogenase